MMVMMVFSGMAWATDGVISGGDAPDSADDSSQPAVAPTCDQQATLNALSSPDLASRSSEDNGKLLSQFLECGGTLADLPQEVFDTLFMQGVIELDIVDSSSGMIACPVGDRSACIDIPG
jgi:hypothetical protein